MVVLKQEKVKGVEWSNHQKTYGPFQKHLNILKCIKVQLIKSCPLFLKDFLLELSLTNHRVSYHHRLLKINSTRFKRPSSKISVLLKLDRFKCFSLFWKSVSPFPLPVTPTFPKGSSGDLNMLSFLRPEKNPIWKINPNRF